MDDLQLRLFDTHPAMHIQVTALRDRDLTSFCFSPHDKHWNTKLDPQSREHRMLHEYGEGDVSDALWFSDDQAEWRYSSLPGFEYNIDDNKYIYCEVSAEFEEVDDSRAKIKSVSFGLNCCQDAVWNEYGQYTTQHYEEFEIDDATQQLLFESALKGNAELVVQVPTDV